MKKLINLSTNGKKSAHKSRLYLSPSHLAGGVALSGLLLSGVLYGESVRAQSVKSWGQPNPLLNSVAGKLTLKADVGYLQNFATTWLENDKATKFYNRANGTVGYGASLGWTHTSGFGLSADYLGWANNWGDNGMQYNANYHVVTITPSYRFSFGENNVWGVKFGLGLGVSYSDITWGDGTQSAKSAQTTNKSGAIITPNNTPIKTAGGAAYLDISKLPTIALPEGSGVTITNLCGRAAAHATVAERIYLLYDSGATVEASRNKCATSLNVLTPTFTDDQLVQYLTGLTFTNNTKIQRSKLSVDGYSDYTNLGNFRITPHLNLDQNNNFYGPVADAVLNSFWWAATNGVIAYSSNAGVTGQEFGWKAFLDTTANLDRLLTALPTNDPGSSLQSAPANSAYISTTTYNAITGDNKTKLDAIIEAGKIAVGSAPASSGAAKDDVGFVIAPQIAIEYDNGLLHADVNFRYIHAVKDVKYNGVGTANNDRYQLAGPLAMFIGAGFGINF